MICIRLMGGVGNQMFQYACGRALSIKNKTTLVLDISQLNSCDKGITKRFFELYLFPIDAVIADDFQLKGSRPLLYRLINTILIKMGLGGIQVPNYFIERSYSYNAGITKIKNICFLSGYWQSQKYFQGFENTIRKDFTFKKNECDRFQLIKEKIKHSDSISLHIRRKDFNENIAHSIHGTCSLEYYKLAIDFIKTKINSPTFFIFSDDIEWAKSNLKILHYCYFISGNSSHEDMHLMSISKHNIIANSSFSWWGAYLNENSEKIVIAPKIWFSKKKLNDQTGDLIPDAWIRI